jgi:hypothetical protein
MRSQHEQTSDAEASSTPHGPSTSALYYSQAEAAADLGMSENGLGLARQRREVDGLYTTIGRRVLWSRPGIRLRALGLSDPAALGRFCKALGINNMSDLLSFLVPDDHAEPH